MPPHNHSHNHHHHQSPATTPAKKISRLHSFMDRQCKWIVSSCVFSICLVNTYVDARTVVVPYFVLGALVTAVSGKILKKVLKQARPEGAEFEDFGMPSSHAVSLGYLSTAVCVASAIQMINGSIGDAHRPDHQPLLQQQSLLIVQGVFALACGLYFSLLRIRHGHHTVAQVLCGYTYGFMGCVLVALVNYLGWSPVSATNPLGGRVDDERYLSHNQRIYLNAAFVIAAVSFAFKYCRKWLTQSRGSLVHAPRPSDMFTPTAANPSFLGLQPASEERKAFKNQ